MELLLFIEHLLLDLCNLKCIAFAVMYSSVSVFINSTIQHSSMQSPEYTSIMSVHCYTSDDHASS